MSRVVFDTERCKGCGLCLAFCPTRVISLEDGLNRMGYHPAVILDETECTSCAACAWMCPDLVIEVHAPARSGERRAKVG